MNLYVVGPRDTYPTGNVVNTTSRSFNWSRGLSPFFLGPCKAYDGHVARNVENLWQKSKVYPCHVNDNGDPTDEYFEWRNKGWDNPKAERYPMGKGAKPLYSYWEGQKLTYVEARKKIYIPAYYNAVRGTPAFYTLKMTYELAEEDLYLWDFDGYNHKELDMTYDEVVNSETRKMGHAFVLAMILENFTKYF
jgi:hypothetical protein